MNAAPQKLVPPQPRDFGLEPTDGPGESFENIQLGGLNIPKKLSPSVNWVLGLSVAVPLSLWTLWGLIKQIDSLAMGIAFGLFSGVVVFQLAVAVVPLCVDASLSGLRLLIDEVSAMFSEKARAEIAYRKALNAYRDALARGGYDQ